MNNKVIQSVHIYLLLILSSGFMLHVLILPSLLTASHRDSWLSVLASLVPFLFWTILVFYIIKRMGNKNILNFLSSILPSPIKWVLFLLLTIHFLFTAFITFKYTVIWAKANYSMEIPTIYIVSFFTIICFYASYKGIRTISTTAFIIVPFVVIFGFIVGIGNGVNKDYTLLFPIFQGGTTHFFKGLIYSCAGYFEILYIIFLTTHLSDNIKLKWLLIICVILLVLILGPLTGAISEFGWFEAEKFRNPAYEQWKLLGIGFNVARLDFLAIFQWFSGAIIRISLSVYLANSIITNRKQTNWSLPILFLFICIAIFVPWGSTSFVHFVHYIYLPISLIFFCCLMGILLILIMWKGKK